MDSSLPVLVSRLPDQRALTALVRAALRHEVAQVPLTTAPQRSEPHTLDLHVTGKPPLALLAEPAGAPSNGRFPLRLKPLYRAQAAQLYALLEAENAAGDAPPDTPLAAGAPLPSRASAGSDTPLALAAPKPRAADDDLRRTAPSAAWTGSLVQRPPPVIALEGSAGEPVASGATTDREPGPDGEHAPSSGPQSEGPATIHDVPMPVSRSTQPDEADSFFDAALATFPRPGSFAEVSPDELAIVPDGDEDDGDNDQTLIRPPSTRQFEAAVPVLDEDPKKKAETLPNPNGDGPPPPSDPIVGRRIADGKYVLESLIGSGATGAVYKATHRELRRTVAIKILHPHYQQDPQFMSDFRDEALAASQLDHPNVMRVLDFDQEPDGLIYIVMEYLSGRTLQNLLDEERRIPTERAVEIMIQVCAALSVAHDHGIIHRDIKPDNIMLVPSRNDEGTSFELVKVCDFGIAALQNPRADDSERANEEPVIAGTPEYMSPEQVRGAVVDARSDVYACGICLYELVTGRPPFLGANPGEIMVKQLQELPRPPSQLAKGIDPIIEEIILRALQKDPANRHQSAREMRVELKELIEPGNELPGEQDERSLIENVPVLDDPASGFTGFFIAFASAILRYGRFERGHHEAAQATKELAKSLHTALRGRSELSFARRDVQKAVTFVVMTGSAEIVDLRRLLGSQLFGSFGQPFVDKLVEKGVGAVTLREGIPESELGSAIELLLGPLRDEDLKRELLGKPLRSVSALFVSDIVGRDRSLSWKVGFSASRLARDLRALCNVRGISLKKMRETRDELVGGVARLLTRGDEVKQFLFNADLVDEAVANLRGFSSFQVAPLLVERVLHEPCAEAAMILLADYEKAGPDEDRIRPLLPLFAQRLVTERSPKSDAAVAELYRRKIITDADVPRDLKEAIRAQTLADGIAREPSQFLLTLDLIVDPEMYEHELTTLEAAMTVLARRGEATALLAVMTTLARHAKGNGKAGARENAALRSMKSMLDQQRLLPVAKAALVGAVHQRDAARQLLVLAGSIGIAALYAAREGTTDPAARPIFVQILRDAGPAGAALLSQVLPVIEVRDDAELALVDDLLRALPDRADPVLGDAVARFLAHPALRPAALAALVPLWGERAKRPLVEALEYADEPTRVVALGGLRRLRAIDEHVVSVIERFLVMRGSAGDDLRAAAAAALADVGPPLRTRAVQLLSKGIEGKRGLVALLRGSESDESVVVMEVMARSLLTLDRSEGVRAVRARASRSEGVVRQRLTALLQSVGS